jgi:predicted Zn finger-like uncharacterized protein
MKLETNTPTAKALGFASSGPEIILSVTIKCPKCHALFATHLSTTDPPPRSWEDVRCHHCQHQFNYSDEIQSALNAAP